MSRRCLTTRYRCCCSFRPVPRRHDNYFTVYPVTDLKRARQFYETTLGLKEARFFGDENKGFVEYDIGAGTLAIGVGAPEWKPSRGGGCAALEVDDFDEAMNRLRECGCTFTLEPMETSVCHMAVASDPDGNSVMIHRRKAGPECQKP